MRPDFNAPKSDWIDYANDLELMTGITKDSITEAKLRLVHAELQKHKSNRNAGAPQQARVLFHLSQRPEGLSHETLLNLVSKNEDVSPELVKVIVTRARANFKEIWGINPIQNSWGWGYIMTPEAIKIIKKVIEGEKNGTEN